MQPLKKPVGENAVRNGAWKRQSKAGMKGRQRIQSPERALGAPRWENTAQKTVGFSFQLKTGIYPRAAMMSQLRFAPSVPGTNPPQALLQRLKPNCTKDMKVNNGRRQIIALLEGNIENLKKFLG